MVKMQLSVLTALLVLGVLATQPVSASEQEMRAELQQAQEQIRQLRAELDEVKQLRTELQQLKEQGSSYQANMAQALKDIPAAAEGENGTFILPAGWTVKPYGYIKLDAIWEDSKGQGGGDLTFWAFPETTTTRSDDTFAVTARQTRLGAIITAPNIGDAKVRGVIETDFYGTAAQEHKAALRMRRAFGEVTGSDWMLLFGQEWEIVSPLFPDTLNFSYGGAMGNLGFRQPQIRFDKWWDIDGCQLKAQVALQREINNQSQIGSYDNGTDTGPSGSARLGLTMPSCMVENKSMTFGVSGHFGNEEVDTDINDRDLDNNYTESRAGQDEKVHTWSVNADFVFPIISWLDFSGEVFMGENLDSREGGIYQGVRQMTNASTAPGRLDEIEAMGGWGQFTITPCPEWKFNVGMMVDDPQNAGIDDGMRARNTTYYTNGRYYFSKYLWTGLEVMYFDTQYKGSRVDGFYDGDLVRLQHSWCLNF